MRRAALACGAGLLAALWLGPLPALAAHAFAAHMALHVLVVAVAAPLLALGLAGGRLDPVRRRPALFAAVPASLIEFALVWAWHAPALHQASRQADAMFMLEQASYLAAGLLLWLAAYGGSARRRRERAAAGIAALLLTSMHMTLLGVLLALAERPLYGHGTALGALHDQQLGGVIMLGVGGSVYLLGALCLLGGLLRDSPVRAAPWREKRDAG